MKKTLLILFFLTFFSCTNQYNSNEDSIRINEYKEKSYKYLSQNDSILFFKFNKEYLLYALKQRDTTSIADSYWSYAIYYNKKEANDSAFKYFLKSYRLYEKQHNLSAISRQLYDIAKIKSRIRDFTGAEKLLYQSLEYNSDKDLEILIRNFLGVIYNNLNEFKESFENYNIALELIKENDKFKYLEKIIYNNLGILFQKQKDYDKSLDYFYKALAEIDKTDISRLARYNTNIFHTKMLMGNISSDIEDGLLSSLNQRIDINIPTDIIDGYYSLSKYYQAVNNKEKSLLYATKALEIATQHDLTRDKLKIYLLLADLSPENAINYYRASIKLKDSLELIDRAIRNKYARVEYDTKKFKIESNRLSKTNNYLISSIFLLITLFILIIYIRKQRANAKQLRLEAEIEKDKVEMFKLSVQSHKSFEKGINEERKRISMELHDGLLSSITSMKLSLSVINRRLIHKGFSDIIRVDYEKEITDLENNIRRISHGLYNSINNKYDFISILTQNIFTVNSINATIEQIDEINWKDVNEYVQLNILRIIQEAFKNTHKHSKATEFKVIFHLSKNALKITIYDDGIGFNVLSQFNGIGLKNIKTRVIENLRGTYDIASNNNGTIIKIIIPNLYENY